jgi:hypothetical protein
LTSALDGGVWSASRFCCFTPREGTPYTYWIGGWVGLKAGLHTGEKRKILRFWESKLDHPDCSLSLYQLSHPDSSFQLYFS